MSQLGHGNSATDGFDAPVAHTHQRQTITNTRWPYHDKAGPHARGIRDAAEPIDVTARLVFSNDGEEYVDGRAVAWANGCVLIAVNDQRLRPGLVWVDASDVTRR